MIDINELRRLAQAATPGPWSGCGPSFGESLPKYLNEVVVDREGDEDDGYSICNAPIGMDEEHSADMAFIAAANPAAVSELLDRLEAAESDALEQARLNGMGSSREAALMAKLEAAERDRATFIMEIGNLCTKVEALREQLSKQRSLSQAAQHLAEVAQRRADALRAKIEEMEQQEPVAEIGQQYTLLFVGSGSMTELVKRHGIKIGTKLYPAPGAQPAPSIPEISDDLIEVIESRAEQSYRRHHGGIRGQQVTPADALSWHIIHATRHVLAAAPEAKP